MSSGDLPIGTSQNKNPPVSPGQGERKADSVEPEILLNAILRNASDYAVITLDRDRRVTSWNIGAELVLGWKAEEIIGHSGDIIFTAEDRECKGGRKRSSKRPTRRAERKTNAGTFARMEATSGGAV